METPFTVSLTSLHGKLLLYVISINKIVIKIQGYFEVAT